MSDEAPAAAPAGGFGNWLEGAINAVENTTGLDLDMDGDVGQAGGQPGSVVSNWVEGAINAVEDATGLDINRDGDVGSPPVNAYESVPSPVFGHRREFADTVMGATTALSAAEKSPPHSLDLRRKAVNYATGNGVLNSFRTGLAATTATAGQLASNLQVHRLVDRAVSYSATWCYRAPLNSVARLSSPPAHCSSRAHLRSHSHSLLPLISRLALLISATLDTLPPRRGSACVPSDARSARRSERPRR